MRRDDVCLREMLAAAEQLIELRGKPEAERLLREDAELTFVPGRTGDGKKLVILSPLTLVNDW
jgi:hypothetical protein